MSVTRSRNSLLQAESMLDRKKYLRALILALIGIGWMLDDITSYFAEGKYKEVDWVEIKNRKIQGDRDERT